MNENQFWSMIGAPICVDQAAQLKRIRELLAECSVEDILDWHHILETYRNIANREDLWVTCAALGANYSDDGFSDFRTWLISRGERVYKDAIRNVNSLFTVPFRGENLNFEVFAYVAYDAYGKKLSLGKVERIDAMFEALQAHPLDEKTVEDIYNGLPQIRRCDLPWIKQMSSVVFPEHVSPSEPKSVSELLNSLNVAYGYATEGGQRTRYMFYNTPENIANFIGSHLQASDIIVTDILDRLILNTIGCFIDRCPDKLLLEKVKEILIPIQTGQEKAKPFLCPTMDEVEKCQAQQDAESMLF